MFADQNISQLAFNDINKFWNTLILFLYDEGKLFSKT